MRGATDDVRIGGLFLGRGRRPWRRLSVAASLLLLAAALLRPALPEQLFSPSHGAAAGCLSDSLPLDLRAFAPDEPVAVEAQASRTVKRIETGDAPGPFALAPERTPRPQGWLLTRLGPPADLPPSRLAVPRRPTTGPPPIRA